MARDDSVYDLILVIGHNDDPVRPGLGSAIFVHIAQRRLPADRRAASRLARDDLLEVLRRRKAGDRVEIEV